MIIDNLDGMVILRAEGNNKITNEARDFFTETIYLGKNDSPDNYEEVGRDVWKHFVKEDNPDIQELQNIANDLQVDVATLKEDNSMLTKTQLIAEETDNMIMTAIADSDEKHETLADVLLCAIDELFTMVEPILTVNEELCVMGEEKKSKLNSLGGDSMVELYAVMVQRGLKTIEQVPARYREKVQALLESVEE